MSAFINITGQRYGRLVVISRMKPKPEAKEQNRAYWLCRCDCGNTTTVSSHALRSKNTMSCGCYSIDATRFHFTTHGYAPSGKQGRTYRIWAGMRNRCRNPNNKNWARYGGRGITVCERWDSFSNFLADMGEVPPGLTIDRIDNNGNYAPDNCRWATRLQQTHNRHGCKL